MSAPVMVTSDGVAVAKGSSPGEFMSPDMLATVMTAAGLNERDARITAVTTYREANPDQWDFGWRSEELRDAFNEAFLVPNPPLPSRIARRSA